MSLKKKILGISLSLIRSLGMVGCGSSNDVAKPNSILKDTNKRITIEDFDMDIYEYIDQSTGVHYYITNGRYRSGICPVYDSNGNIVIDK